MKTKHLIASFSAATFLMTPTLWADGIKLSLDQSPPERTGEHAGYAPIVEKAAPSVVSIASSKNITVPRVQQRQFLDPFSGRLYQQRQMLPGGETVPQPQGSGSGVILSKDGYIVTNRHVIKEADVIKVAVGEDAELYTAELIGEDEATDIAVLKIDAENLPPINISSSRHLKAGDFVLAIGSPFGLPNTVTHGIVSAVGRTHLGITGSSGYEDFIQTDASINPGNSGGVLVDNRGRMVGINTAIFSKSGGNHGIGFAIPSDLVVNVAEQLIEFGEVQRGFLGVRLGDVTTELAEALKVDRDGAIVHEVVPGSPADEAGIESGDVISSVDGRKVSDAARLRLLVGGIRPGNKVSFKINRSGKELDIECEIGGKNKKPLIASKDKSQRWGGTGPNELVDGLRVSDIDRALRARLGLPSDVTGIFIEEVRPGSRAARAGLKAGEVISEIAKKPVNNTDEAFDRRKEAVASDGKGMLLMRVLSESGARYIAVEVSGESDQG